MKRFIILVVILIVLGAGIPLFHDISDATKMAAFSKVEDSRPPLTQAEVEKLVGQPAHIEQSQSLDQTLTGEIYHYSYHGNDMKVVFVNGTVFHAEYISNSKS